MNNIILAQILGLVALVTNVLGIIASKKNKVFFHNTISNIACIIQYVLLGGYTGAISSLIATLRNFVFTRFKKDIPLYILIIYLIVAVSFNLPYCNGIISILPLFNIIIYGYGIWQNDMERLKKINIMTGIAGMIYDIYSMAFVGFISQLISFIAGIVSYVKYEKTKKLRCKRKKIKR